MIVTIKAPTARSMAVGAFESIKMGLDYQMMPDLYLDIVVADMGFDCHNLLVVTAAVGSVVGTAVHIHYHSLVVAEIDTVVA